MLSTPPWKLPRDLPWHLFTNPVEKWATQPSFVLGEYLFIACAAVALVHAFTQGPERRRHLLAWFGALIAGTANDVIFMALPLVDNFWQAQATIMLTPRLPLYIPCVYVCFMYFPVVSTWRLNLPPLSRAALSGLAGMLFYAPYDVVGAKFLWWTWHDSDMPIANRLLGAPVGSTLWTLTFTATFAWLLGRTVDRDPAVSRSSFIKGLALVAGCSSVLMVVQMTALQQLDGGVPGIRGLVTATAIYIVITCLGLRRGRPEPRRRSDRPLHVAAVVYFLSLMAVMALFDPATHKSASMHQTYGPCRVEATDITGHTRFKFLCAEDFDEDFSFTCVDKLPSSGSEWYTVCGRAHRSFSRWMFGVSAYCLLGILLYSLLLGALRPRRPDSD
jgi:hypothetical protein